MEESNKEPAWMTSCRLRGETVYTKNGTYNPIKSASVESKQEEISSWARLQKLQNDESAIKSAATEEHQLSSWARLHRLGSAN
jgi:hypothetical protein